MTALPPGTYRIQVSKAKNAIVNPKGEGEPFSVAFADESAKDQKFLIQTDNVNEDLRTIFSPDTKSYAVDADDLVRRSGNPDPEDYTEKWIIQYTSRNDKGDFFTGYILASQQNSYCSVSDNKIVLTPEQVFEWDFIKLSD